MTLLNKHTACLGCAQIVAARPGLRLPVVMTCANRSISAPINIWNDHQDAMAVRDAGWIMLWAENIQEAIEQHWLALILSQKLRLPVMVNVDGFRLTHASEPVILPQAKLIHKLLTNKIKPVLDVNQPQTTGWFALPEVYHRQRLSLKKFIAASWPIISQTTNNFNALWEPIKHALENTNPATAGYQGTATHYYGPDNPNTLIIAMGSIVGELRDIVQQHKIASQKTGILKVQIYRPFPGDEILSYLDKASKIIVIDRAPGLGAQPPLFSDIKTSLPGGYNKKISNIIVGLGGDARLTEINKIINKQIK